MLGKLIALGVATLASEDLACIAAGVLVSRGDLDFAAAAAACSIGIFAGDVGLFTAGRIIGRPALKWRLLRRISESAIDRASEWFSRRGPAVILLSRFSPGLRLPTYFAAGLTGVRSGRLLMWFGIAAAVWTPLLVGASALFGAAVLARALARLPLAALVCVAIAALSKLRQRVLRRRLHAFFCRMTRWEFWPVWAAYLPLVPYLLYLACKHRSATVFTAVNPGIPVGGLAGESKWQILEHLRHAGDLVARSWRLTAPYDTTLLRGLAYPLVLKPDVGERGRGVAIIRSDRDLTTYLETAQGDLIAQEYVTGPEFGVFYVRRPGEARGHIVSITEKQFPELTGDGRRSVRDLILDDPRAFCIADVYVRNVGRASDDVPPAGQRIPLAQIGSHCRGAIFVDATGLNTAALEDAIDRVSKLHPGFYFGRYDLRAESVEALRQGRGFKILELNGVGAEATHIYDPAVGIREAYRVMRRQWRTAFEIGALNRACGERVVGIVELLRIVLRRGR